MTEEEKDEIVERISKNVYNIVLELGWYIEMVTSDDTGGEYTKPTYESVVGLDD